jgi:arabinose-5-phosphate isomerase
MPSLLAAHDTRDDRHFLALAQDVLHAEAGAIQALVPTLGAPFLAALRLMLSVRGRVVVTGIGKSGHIAGKIASTLASTGTPAFFMHPAEAIHGDLGMIARDDLLLALSHSGESEEVVRLMAPLKRRGTPIVAMTGRAQSALAEAADVHLLVPVAREACPLGLAPTTSTTATLALGDALALALLDARGFTAEDFALHHPGGTLGRRLLLRVRDLMRVGDAVPRVPVDALLPRAILEISAKGLGMTAVVDSTDKVAGIFTDFDLRRAIERHDVLRGVAVKDEMNTAPRSIGPDRLAAEAASVMQTGRAVSVLLVVDASGTLLGALHVNDLLKAGLI